MPQPTPTFTVYKFTAPYKQSYCITMDGTGCLEWASRNFKVGDTVVSMGDSGVVSDGTNPPFVNGLLYGADADGGMGSIPLSVLNKVATDIEASQLNTYISNISQSNTTSGNTASKSFFTPKISQSNTTSGNTASKSFFTPKNVIIGLLAIGVIVGGLKLAKVI